MIIKASEFVQMFKTKKLHIEVRSDSEIRLFSSFMYQFDEHKIEYMISQIKNSFDRHYMNSDVYNPDKNGGFVLLWNSGSLTQYSKHYCLSSLPRDTIVRMPGFENESLILRNGLKCKVVGDNFIDEKERIVSSISDYSNGIEHNNIKALDIYMIEIDGDGLENYKTN